MKLYRFLIYLMPIGLFTVSCNKFLDVKPKTQIDAEDVFKDEQGYMDALTGVYLNMDVNALYGRELTYGFTDVIGKQHTVFSGTSQEYYYTAQYAYLRGEVRGKIDGIYGGMYNAIAEDNNIIGHLQADGAAKFSGVNFRIIHGEAHALRALLHFDLLRLFGPSPVAADAGTIKAIPYLDQLTVAAPPRLTVKEVVDKVIADLAVAETDLLAADPIVPGSTTPTTTTGFLRNRRQKMNYYAVKALQARVYLYAGDKPKALAAAQTVINSGVYPLTPANQVAGNRLFSQELIFALYKSDMAANVTSYFTPPASGAGAGNLLTKTVAEYNTVYESTTDVRYSQLTAYDNVTQLRYGIKLGQVTSSGTQYTTAIPVFRVSELYYIAAECLKESNPADAAAYVSQVRVARDATPLSGSLTPAQLQDEIFKEYRREFYCEGQLFHYYKRLNAPQINGLAVTATQYVLPLPDDETTYGNGGN